MISARRGHLHEQFDRRERDVQEETDGEVRSQGSQHLRDQLQLVVLDPYGRPGAAALAVASANRRLTST